MRSLLIALLAAPAVVAADAYVALPADSSKALYFPNVSVVQCYSVVIDGQPAMVSTNRCAQVFLPAILVEGSLLLLNRPLEQLLASCAFLDCELRAMPSE